MNTWVAGIGVDAASSLARSLERSRGTASLVLLDLSWNSVNGDSCSALAALVRSSHTLEELRLAWNGIDDDAALALLTVMHESTSLRRIDLSCNRLSSVAATVVARMAAGNVCRT